MYGQYLTCYSLALGMLVTVVGLVGCSQPKDAATQSAAGDRANDSGVQEPAGKVLNVKSSRPLCEVPFIFLPRCIWVQQEMKEFTLDRMNCQGTFQAVS